MTDTTKLTPHCLIRWGAGVPVETREATLRKMQAIRPAKPRKPHNYERAQREADRAATARLTAPPVEQLAPDGRCMVRIYYQSMGNETLCFDVGPMSWQAADRMESEYNSDGCSMTLGAERFWATDDHPVRKGARLVVLPSQRAEPVESTVDPEIAPTLTLCAPVESDPEVEIAAPPRQVFNTYYGEAMAKRAKRFQTMHRRPIAA